MGADARDGMIRSQQHFDGFPPHSRYKHLILKKYFEMWGRKLLLGDARRSRVVYVDACAGRGADESGVQGSPVIAAVAAADAAEQLAAMPGGVGKHVIVLAIEKAPRHYRALADNLAEFGPDVRALAGTLGDHLAAIEHELQNAPTLYFVDPFGVEPLQADVVRRALAGSKNEVLLLFADQAALRHFGAVRATETEAMRKLRRRREAPSLFDDHDAQDLATLAPAAARSGAALTLTQERSTEILNAAFGSTEWGASIATTPPAERRAKVLSLYRDLLASFGAEFVLSFPVRKATGEHAYTLIHASKSIHARRTMQEAVTYALRHAAFMPEAVLEAMRDDLRTDLGPVVELIKARWAGQEVQWTPEGGIRWFALDGATVWPFQLPELKALLKPYRRPARGPETYAFPTRPA